MRLTNWLEDVMGSPTRIAVLRLLDRTFPTEYTLREIGRALTKGPSTVSVAINALQSLGVVEARRLGNSNGYRLRRGPVRNLLGELFATEQKLKQITEKAIARATPKGTSSFVFGSVARGEQKPTSDLDILVVAQDKATAEAVAENIRASTGDIGFVAPQTFALGKSDFARKANEPWLMNAKKEARHIAGPALEAWA